MDTQTVISLILSGAMFVIAMVTLVRNGRKDRKQDYVEEFSKIHEIEQVLANINARLDQLFTQSIETRADIKSMNSNWIATEKRVTVLETQMETVWKRIDELKEKVNHYHEGA